MVPESLTESGWVSPHTQTVRLTAAPLSRADAPGHLSEHGAQGAEMGAEVISKDAFESMIRMMDADGSGSVDEVCIS